MPVYTLKHTAVVAVTGTTAKCVCALITPATRRARVLRLTIGGKSVNSAHAPGLVEFVQFDTDGTGTASTPAALDSAETASLCTAKVNYTVEPSANPVVRSQFPLSPQGVTGEKTFIPSAEIVVPVSKVLGVRVTMPDTQDIWFELEYLE